MAAMDTLSLRVLSGSRECPEWEARELRPQGKHGRCRCPATWFPPPLLMGVTARQVCPVTRRTEDMGDREGRLGEGGMG